MKNYKWKLSYLGKGVPPKNAVKELSRIETKYGKLTPNMIVEESRSKNAVLHTLFEWDDTKAAHHYRVQQARVILNNVEIISGQKEVQTIDVYEFIKSGKGNQYKHIETLTLSEREQVIKATKEAIKQLKKKLQTYSNFEAVLEYLELALIELK